MQIYGKLLESDFNDKLWGYQIRNFDEYDGRYVTSFRFYDSFTGIFKSATGKKFIEALKEEVAKNANLKLSFVKFENLHNMKIIYSRQKGE